jgi:hypothetical protein
MISPPKSSAVASRETERAGGMTTMTEPDRLCQGEAEYEFEDLFFPMVGEYNDEEFDEDANAFLNNITLESAGAPLHLYDDDDDGYDDVGKEVIEGDAFAGSLRHATMDQHHEPSFASPAAAANRQRPPRPSRTSSVSRVLPASEVPSRDGIIATTATISPSPSPASTLFQEQQQEAAVAQLRAQAEQDRDTIQRLHETMAPLQRTIVRQATRLEVANDRLQAQGALIDYLQEQLELYKQQVVKLQQQQQQQQLQPQQLLAPGARLLVEDGDEQLQQQESSPLPPPPPTPTMRTDKDRDTEATAQQQREQELSKRSSSCLHLPSFRKPKHVELLSLSSRSLLKKEQQQQQQLETCKTNNGSHITSSCLTSTLSRCYSAGTTTCRSSSEEGNGDESSGSSATSSGNDSPPPTTPQKHPNAARSQQKKKAPPPPYRHLHQYYQRHYYCAVSPLLAKSSSSSRKTITSSKQKKVQLQPAQ